MAAQSPGLEPRDVDALRRPSAYPLDESARDGVEAVQTHISWVFLTRERVYKFRKPVTLGFVDFASRAQRTADCLREVALNRRLAPGIYLGIAPLRPSIDGLSVGATAETPKDGDEHCVVMRRLPAGRDGLSLLEKGELGGSQLRRLARVLSDFHTRAHLGKPAPWPPTAWRARFARPTEENFRLLGTFAEQLAPRAALERGERAARSFLVERARHVERRRREGRAVDGHGDLHLAHVWYLEGDAEPLVIDCLEFNDELRHIDGAADIAFLAMDLIYRGRRDLAELFLAAYAEEHGDHHLYTVVDYHIAYRAAVRATVAALTAKDESVPVDQRERAAGSARRHLELAADVLAQRPERTVVVLCGVVGSGKSTVARSLAELLAIPRIASDRIRERLLASVPRARRYTNARRARVYRELVRAAADVLVSGRAVVLDATFDSAAERASVLRLAAEAGAVAWLVETVANEASIRQRLAARRAAGTDPSDAGPAQYAASVARFEPPTEWPNERRIVLRTDVEGWEREIRGLAARLRASV